MEDIMLLSPYSQMYIYNKVAQTSGGNFPHQRKPIVHLHQIKYIPVKLINSETHPSAVDHRNETRELCSFHVLNVITSTHFWYDNFKLNMSLLSWGVIASGGVV